MEEHVDIAPVKINNPNLNINSIEKSVESKTDENVEKMPWYTKKWFIYLCIGLVTFLFIFIIYYVYTNYKQQSPVKDTFTSNKLEYNNPYYNSRIREDDIESSVDIPLNLFKKNLNTIDEECNESLESSKCVKDQEPVVQELDPKPESVQELEINSMLESNPVIDDEPIFYEEEETKEDLDDPYETSNISDDNNHMNLAKLLESDDEQEPKSEAEPKAEPKAESITLKKQVKQNISRRRI